MIFTKEKIVYETTANVNNNENNNSIKGKKIFIHLDTFTSKKLCYYLCLKNVFRKLNNIVQIKRKNHHQY